MVSDGARFIHDDIVGVHTLSSLTSSWVAHDRATEDNHTQQTESLILSLSYTLTYSGSESGSNLDRGVLNPSPGEYHIYININSLAYETVREVQSNKGLIFLDPLHQSCPYTNRLVYLLSPMSTL